jgi:hypothetical protein
LQAGSLTASELVAMSTSMSPQQTEAAPAPAQMLLDAHDATVPSGQKSARHERILQNERARELVREACFRVWSDSTIRRVAGEEDPSLNTSLDVDSGVVDSMAQSNNENSLLSSRGVDSNVLHHNLPASRNQSTFDVVESVGDESKVLTERSQPLFSLSRKRRGCKLNNEKSFLVSTKSECNQQSNKRPHIGEELLGRSMLPMKKQISVTKVKPTSHGESVTHALKQQSHYDPVTIAPLAPLDPRFTVQYFPLKYKGQVEDDKTRVTEGQSQGQQPHQLLIMKLALSDGIQILRVLLPSSLQCDSEKNENDAVGNEQPETGQSAQVASSQIKVEEASNAANEALVKSTDAMEVDTAVTTTSVIVMPQTQPPESVSSTAPSDPMGITKTTSPLRYNLLSPSRKSLLSGNLHAIPQLPSLPMWNIGLPIQQNFNNSNPPQQHTFLQHLHEKQKFAEIAASPRSASGSGGSTFFPLISPAMHNSGNKSAWGWGSSMPVTTPRRQPFQGKLTTISPEDQMSAEYYHRLYFSDECETRNYGASATVIYQNAAFYVEKVAQSPYQEWDTSRPLTQFMHTVQSLPSECVGDQKRILECGGAADCQNGKWTIHVTPSNEYFVGNNQFISIAEGLLCCTQPNECFVPITTSDGRAINALYKEYTFVLDTPAISFAMYITPFLP